MISGIGGTLTCYEQLPPGIQVGSPVRAVVLLDGQVGQFIEQIPALDCGEIKLSVNRS